MSGIDRKVISQIFDAGWDACEAFHQSRPAPQVDILLTPVVDPVNTSGHPAAVAQAVLDDMEKSKRRRLCDPGL